MHVHYWDFQKLYKALYTRFVNAYVDRYSNKDSLFWNHYAVIATPTDVGLPHGITGTSTVYLYLQDVRGDKFTNASNLLVTSHELCHAIAVLNGNNPEITKVLHDYHGEHATKPLSEILTDFTFRAKFSTFSLMKPVTVRVIDYEKLERLL